MRTVVATLLLASVAQAASAQTQRPDQAEFRSLYKELVETNTEVTDGSCTQAATQLAARLRAAGITDSQITLFSTPDHPKDGGIVVVYPGSSNALKPLLLLAHIDVLV